MRPASPVEVRRETVVLPTYEPHAPDRNPMFLENRVYQGSSGRVYPLPFTDRVATQPAPRDWEAVLLENEYLLVMLLPQLGGRIHRILDKTNGYDAIYHQPVIKPALVGLAGPWCSGGIEFNWPQHHRPSTFMPTDVAVEHHADGAATVWLSEHDPMARMKGMHGVRLHPGRSWVELAVRVYNRTTDVQTFLWWANAATRVHEGYQSFFPPDAAWVADHARRAMSTFPRCSGTYYGVDYGARGRRGVPEAERPPLYVPVSGAGAADEQAAHSAIPSYASDDLSWYANIPVPTSYMCVGSNGDFFGGYDHKAQAGIVHVADHHIAPGKKQWTWGNHAFGYAWDRNLTDPDPSTGEYPPYIELMAGVFTDNQPDFSFLQPGETKTWSQFWYPIRQIGPAQNANREAAMSLHFTPGQARIGVATTTRRDDAQLRLEHRGRIVGEWQQTLAPENPLVFETRLPAGAQPAELTLSLSSHDGRELIRYTPPPPRTAATPAPAAEPPAPRATPSSDELYLTGLHLEQYRHATRKPEDYWREGLRRDPGDARCHLALGRWRLRRGEFSAAEEHLRASIARLTARNANPCDGEAFYQLGRCLQLQAFSAAKDGAALLADPRLAEAEAAFHKAAWNHAWQPAAFHALAEIAGARGDWLAALDPLARALNGNADNLRARNLQVIALRRLGRHAEADTQLAATRRLDPLDWWACHLAGEPLHCDNQVRLDLAIDCARAGLFGEAIELLAGASSEQAGRPDASWGTKPMVHYYRAWLSALRGDRGVVRSHLAAARRANPDYCFPARLEDMIVLQFARTQHPNDARAPFFLGHLLYDRQRHAEAISCWRDAVRLEPANAIAWRNLGMAHHNISGDRARARQAYERAFRANPKDARLLYERDQLWKRLGEPPAKRLRELLKHPKLVQRRDDLAVELCALYNQTGRAGAALGILATRRFQPWEGGEGEALRQHVRAQLALGRAALRRRQPQEAIAAFTAALGAPENLGETKHLLANQSDLHFWLGCAHAAAGNPADAERHWRIAANWKGDFQVMAVQSYSELSYFSARALERLGERAAAAGLFRRLLRHARTLGRTPAKIDYFATSLPTMLLFDDDLAARQKTTALFLEAQARLGLGQRAAGKRLLAEVLRRDPNHALAAEFASETEAAAIPVARRSPARR